MTNVLCAQHVMCYCMQMSESGVLLWAKARKRKHTSARERIVFQCRPKAFTMSQTI